MMFDVIRVFSEIQPSRVQMIPALPVLKIRLPLISRFPPEAQIPRAGVFEMMLPVITTESLRGSWFHGAES